VRVSVAAGIDGVAMAVGVAVQGDVHAAACLRAAGIGPAQPAAAPQVGVGGPPAPLAAAGTGVMADAITDDDARFMREALALATGAAAGGDVPVGAVVVRDGQVLGRGSNRTLKDGDPTAHAEIVALRAAARAAGNHRLPGATLYVSIEPCTMCAGALVHARIARLVFGAREPRAGAVVSTARVLDNVALNHRVVVDAGVLADEAAAQLRQFFAARRR
jgi:tRNA(adenine34) deaminase